MKTFILGSTIAFIVSGCSGMTTMNQDFVLAGNVKGINAAMQGLAGIAKTAKESPDAPNQFFALRSHEERENTIRETSPGFFSNLFGKTASVPTEGS